HTRSATLAIFAVFFFESAVIGQWIPRIPDIKTALALSDSDLGLALLSMPLGTLFGFSIAGKIIGLTGLRMACRIFLPLWAVLFIGPALAKNFTQLVAALILSGVAIGMIETAMNTEAARIEKVAGKRLMSRCHGFWSFGTMVGALIGGSLAQSGMSVSTHFLIAMPLIAIGGYFAATALPVLAKVVANEPESEDNKNTQLFRLPAKAILLLCIMPLGIMMVEGAFIDWSAVFMRDVLEADPLIIAVTYSFFSVVMALVRFSGDAVANRYGDVTVVRVSGLAATIGIATFALAPTIVVAFIAAAIAGAGVAIVFPLAVSAAANKPGRSSADNVASLNMIAFTAFLIAPPIIGFLSDLFSLRLALLALAPLAFLTFILAGEVKQKGGS
ncbi:MAG: MFS transporter, partial [Granulosicoccus sp.]